MPFRSNNLAHSVASRKKIPVGFMNPGSLMDLLPSKRSAQQTTLRTTRNSWADPNT